MSELTNYGPLTIPIQGSNIYFQSAGADGFVDNCLSTTSIDHAVLLVGYTETHWIIKNSWGTGWGNQGFGYISRTNDCGIKTVAYLFEVDADTPPLPASQQVEVNIGMTDKNGNGW